MVLAVVLKLVLTMVLVLATQWDARIEVFRPRRDRPGSLVYEGSNKPDVVVDFTSI